MDIFSTWTASHVARTVMSIDDTAPTSPAKRLDFGSATPYTNRCRGVYNSEVGDKLANPNQKKGFSYLPPTEKSHVTLPRWRENGGTHEPARVRNEIHVGAAPRTLTSPSIPSEHDPVTIVVALFDFTSRSSRELGFKSGDRLKVIREEDGDWLYAKHLQKEAIGYIPRNFVALETSLQSYDWYFGKILRRAAESYLLSTPTGTFLVRDSTSKPGDFALSIKDFDDIRGHHTKHYIIKYVNGEYSIFGKIKFSNLNDLLEEYKVKSHGLPLLLQSPCPKVAPHMNDLSYDTKDEWEINRSEIRLEEEIGTGNFGKVYRGFWRDTTEVAVKTVKKGKMEASTFLEEAKIMKGLRHDNILSLLAVCSHPEDQPIFIITEYMKLGSLLDLLKKSKKEQMLSEDRMLGFAYQIAKGMEYLEQKKLVHRDLAARNVLVNEVPICKIADFGLAKIVDENQLNRVQGGKFPAKWSPPETFLRGEYSIKSDVWSFGIVVVEIFTYGDQVYPSMNNREVQHNVKNGYRLPKPPLCPQPTYEVLLVCWSENPEARPSFKDLADYFDESTHKIVDGTQYLTEEGFAALQRM